MEIVDSLVWLVLIIGIAVLLGTIPRWGLLARIRDWRGTRHRRQLEDALKHMLTLSDRGHAASPESLAGALKLSDQALVGLLEKLEGRGLIHSSRGSLTLTSEGERWALQIVRAHRLWERYLSDEAGMPLLKVHGAAEKAEHAFTPEKLDALDAHLGHPLTDPHGDPIPQADGTVSNLRGTPLTDWDTGTKGYIVHVEDEPVIVLRQIIALGFKVGDPIRILERGSEHIVVAHRGQEHRIAPVVAANIHIQGRELAQSKPTDAITLAELGDKAEAEIIALDPNFRGFARRRLLDLGLTPSTRIRVDLQNAFGDPRGYRVRGTLVALRAEQAKLVWVRPVGKPQAVAEENVTTL